MRKPNAILFDLGDTVLEERRYDMPAGLRSLLASLGQSTANADKLAVELHRQMLDAHKEMRELSLRTWLRERLQTTSPIDAEALLWSDTVTLVPKPHVQATLELIGAQGIPVAAVSNSIFSADILSAELDRHNLRRSFQFVISSADLGVRKPHPHIYQNARDMLECAPDVVWFVGNTWAEDILGAANVGMHPVWLSESPTAPDASFAYNVVRDWKEFVELLG